MLYKPEIRGSILTFCWSGTASLTSISPSRKNAVGYINKLKRFGGENLGSGRMYNTNKRDAAIAIVVALSTIGFSFCFGCKGGGVF